MVCDKISIAFILYKKHLSKRQVNPKKQLSEVGQVANVTKTRGSCKQRCFPIWWTHWRSRRWIPNRLIVRASRRYPRRSRPSPAPSCPRVSKSSSRVSSSASTLWSLLALRRHMRWVWASIEWLLTKDVDGYVRALCAIKIEFLERSANKLASECLVHVYHHLSKLEVF